ncbi:hypothetical protein Tco_1193336 [Tanacetum coccineum]
MIGYSFYYPLENKVLVSRNAKFFENSLITQEARFHKDTNAPQKSYAFTIDAEEHEFGDLMNPANYKAALLDPESDKWIVVMNVKMQSMKDNQV